MARIALPARIWRRKVRYRRNHVRNLSSGAVFLAGGRVSYGIPSEVLLPASFSRRRACSRSRGARNPTSGVILAPEGPLWRESRDYPSSGVILAPEGPSRTESRRKPLLRRRFLAGGSIPAAWRRRRSQAALRQRLRSPAENHRYHARRAASVLPSFSPVRKSKSFS